ncbi:hypothetical protein K6V98_02635 [Collinsella sp. AGMB00827]|uniref:Uncharacterized protein n=1 Tax=Collinsella ureilytica TaxID=2869515 RepID=A0ABS7MIR1_9ACTN|nr:hypothetical protein [Collinsella urealyticum]MBY4797262.1 hypothetical protein [Collinsella urealyticum]
MRNSAAFNRTKKWIKNERVRRARLIEEERARLREELSESQCYEDWVRCRTCLNKHRYRNEQFAASMCFIYMKQFKKPLDWYRCPYCGGWHLTSKKATRAMHVLQAVQKG